MNALYELGVKLALDQVGLLKQAFRIPTGAGSAALGALLGGGAGALTSPGEATAGETIRRTLGGAAAGGAVGHLGGRLLHRQGVLGRAIGMSAEPQIAEQLAKSQAAKSLLKDPSMASGMGIGHTEWGKVQELARRVPILKRRYEILLKQRVYRSFS